MWGCEEEMKRRVVCVYGKYPKGDFVLEPTCTEDCMCDECKNGFWIEKVEPDKPAVRAKKALNRLRDSY